MMNESYRILFGTGLALLLGAVDAQTGGDTHYPSPDKAPKSTEVQSPEQSAATSTDSASPTDRLPATKDMAAPEPSPPTTEKMYGPIERPSRSLGRDGYPAARTEARQARPPRGQARQPARSSGGTG